MITVHHLNNSRSQRVLWLLEELGLDYKIEKYLRDPNTMRAPEELRAVHALGKSPVLADGDITIAESGAIIDYIIATYGPHLKPAPGTPAYRHYVQWMHFAEGSAMPPLLVKLLMDRIATAPAPLFIKPIMKMIATKTRDNFYGPELTNLFHYLDLALSQSDWFAGDDFSGADIQMSFPVEAAVTRGVVDASHSRLHQWVKTIQARPAYQTALQKGGEYAFATASK
jgi:glutathione S-transferase